MQTNINYKEISKDFENLSIQELIFKYKKINIHNIYLSSWLLQKLSMCENKIIYKFIDMFVDNINEKDNSNYTLFDNIIYMIYVRHLYEYKCCKIINYLIEKGCNLNIINKHWTPYNYCEKYINQGIRNNIIIKSLKETILDFTMLLKIKKIYNKFDTIMVLLYLSKVRILPKYVVTRKILYYHLINIHN
jgi:hypothetical protein